MLYGFNCLWHAILSYILMILILIKYVCTKIDEDTILISHFLWTGSQVFVPLVYEELLLVLIIAAL